MNIVREVCSDYKTDLSVTLPAFTLIKDYLIYHSKVMINDFNWSKRKNFILYVNPFLSSYVQCSPASITNYRNIRTCKSITSLSSLRYVLPVVSEVFSQLDIVKLISIFI